MTICLADAGWVGTELGREMEPVRSRWQRLVGNEGLPMTLTVYLLK
jgi:hypothetical protein